MNYSRFENTWGGEKAIKEKYYNISGDWWSTKERCIQNNWENPKTTNCNQYGAFWYPKCKDGTIYDNALGCKDLPACTYTKTTVLNENTNITNIIHSKNNPPCVDSLESINWSKCSDSIFDKPATTVPTTVKGCQFGYFYEPIEYHRAAPVVLAPITDTPTCNIL